MQSPITGTPAATRSRSSSSSARARTRSIAFGIAPTPGSTIASASRTRAWSRGQLGLARRRARAPCRPSAGCPCRSRGCADPLGAHSSALGGGHALDARVLGDRLAQRPREGLERHLDHVVGVGARLHVHVQGQLGRVGHRAEELLGQVGVEVADALGAEVGLERRERPAGDVDRAGRARLVHRHDRAARSGAMPERSPSASSSAWPSAMPVSSTVWWGPVSRSPWTCTSRSRPPWRASASSRWSKKPTPVVRSPAPVAVEAERQRDVGLAW